MAKQKKKQARLGRPPGPPSTVIRIRLLNDLLDWLSRCIDNELQFSRKGDINRTTIVRGPIKEFVNEKGG